MKFHQYLCLFLMTLALSSCGGLKSTQPFLCLHPENPHYFLFRNKPEILIGSTEHYGAVMNLDFNYSKYLNELASSGLNVTRTLSGIYVEPQNVFGIHQNSLAPASGRFICPWARSSTPGYANGGNKFDLAKWDEKYFSRLKDFISEAGKRNIIVELDLFCNFYDTLQWKLSPLYINNNINGIGDTKDQKEILSLKHPEIIAIQENMARKIVSELRDFDNLYYEICNEPYFGDTLALREWEKHMTGIVTDAEKDFRQKHLISNNIANNFLKVANPRPGISIYNFHYARPPLTVDLNYHLGKMIGDNETGFDGIEDAKYRMEGWNFILAGGGLFNNLDYSFTVGKEDGSFEIPKGQPGGGGKILRNQYKILTDFIKNLDFIHMVPVPDTILKAATEENTTLRALSGKDALLAAYLSRKDTVNQSSVLNFDLSPGSYTITWTDTKSGVKTTDLLKDHQGGKAIITSPVFYQDIAFLIAKSK